MTTHLIEDVTYACDTMLLLNKTKIGYYGSPLELITQAEKVHDKQMTSSALEYVYMNILKGSNEQ